MGGDRGLEAAGISKRAAAMGQRLERDFGDKRDSNRELRFP
jgi:hypothetical protein